MTSTGIFTWQETLSSEFGFILSPTFLNKVFSLDVEEQPARYTILSWSLNLGFMSLEEELQILVATDKVSPDKSKYYNVSFIA